MRDDSFSADNNFLINRDRPAKKPSGRRGNPVFFTGVSGDLVLKYRKPPD